MLKIILDIETTGFSHVRDGITEINAFKVDKNYTILKSFYKSLNPQRPIPANVVRLTNKRNSDLIGFPTFSEVRKELQLFLYNYPIYIYSGLDERFLKYRMILANKFIDVLKLVKSKCNLNSYKLKDVCNSFGIKCFDSHSAVPDSVNLLNVVRILKV